MALLRPREEVLRLRQLRQLADAALRREAGDKRRQVLLKGVEPHPQLQP